MNEPSERVCAVNGCTLPYFNSGYCQRHRRHARQGRELSTERLIFRRDSVDDFWARVSKTDGCWEWQRGLTSAGYGKVNLPNRKTGVAHRRAYELVKGPIPDGLVLDHLCRNKRCVNPAHLEAVTVAVNTQRGASSLDFERRCLSGKHSISSPDDYRVLKRGVRSCKQCVIEGSKRRRAMIAEAAATLGLSAHQYGKRYGQSITTAQQILEDAA